MSVAVMAIVAAMKSVIVDPEELFRKLFEEQAEREALKRLSAAAQKQIRRRAEARRLSAAGAA